MTQREEYGQAADARIPQEGEKRRRLVEGRVGQEEERWKRTDGESHESCTTGEEEGGVQPQSGSRETTGERKQLARSKRGSGKVGGVESGSTLTEKGYKGIKLVGQTAQGLKQVHDVRQEVETRRVRGKGGRMCSGGTRPVVGRWRKGRADGWGQGAIGVKEGVAREKKLEPREKEREGDW